MEMEMRENGEGDVRKNEEDANGGGEVMRGYNKEKPPEDDCCPICFGEFKVPCKANCGHWFCGSCVLQLWKYRARPRRCKCPFCSSAITHLTPEASVTNETQFEVVQVLENIEHYNRFYVKGAKGFFLMSAFYIRKHGPYLHLYTWILLRALILIAITSPIFLKRALIGLLRHPEQILLNFHRVQLTACTLSLLLHLFHGFLPSGYLRLKVAKIRLCIDCISILLVIFPYTLIICKTWVHILWLRFRIWQVRREVDALRAHNAILREQEAALRERADVLRDQENVFEENIPLQEKEETDGSAQAEADTALKGKAHVDAVVLSKRDSNVLQEEHVEVFLTMRDSNVLQEDEALLAKRDSNVLQEKHVEANRDSNVLQEVRESLNADLNAKEEAIYSERFKGALQELAMEVL